MIMLLWFLKEWNSMSKKTKTTKAKPQQDDSLNKKSLSEHETRKKIEEILAQREFDRLFEL